MNPERDHNDKFPSEANNHSGLSRQLEPLVICRRTIIATAFCAVDLTTNK